MRRKPADECQVVARVDLIPQECDRCGGVRVFMEEDVTGYVWYECEECGWSFGAWADDVDR